MTNLSIIGRIVALLAGVLPGFFIVFNAIFSDGEAMSERLVTFGLVVAVYGIIGLVFGIVKPSGAWRWGLWLSIPALVMVSLYSVKETQRLLLHFLYVLVTFGSACLGGYIGGMVRNRKNIV